MAKKDALFGLLLADGQSLAASFSSDPFRSKYLDNIGINISASGVTDNTGTFAVQHRIVKDDNTRACSDWATLTLDSVPTLADTDSTFLVSLNQIPPGEIRLVFTAIGGVAEVQTLTFPTKSGSTGGDYVVVYDTTGAAWAVWLDKSGSDSAPTGALYVSVAAGKKARADISGASTAASVAAIAKTALEGLTGFTSVITIVDNSDGTLTLTQAVKAPATNPVPHNANDGGAGSITGVQSTPGSTPDGTCDIWISATSLGG